MTDLPHDALSSSPRSAGFHRSSNLSIEEWTLVSPDLAVRPRAHGANRSADAGTGAPMRDGDLRLTARLGAVGQAEHYQSSFGRTIVHADPAVSTK
jgi:hypothetical protein